MLVVPFLTAPLAGLLLQAAAALPSVDIPKACREAAVFGQDDVSIRSCVSGERAALRRLRILLPKIEAKDRAACLDAAQLGVAPSYVEIVSCLDLTQELRRERQMSVTTKRAAQPSLDRFLLPAKP